MLGNIVQIIDIIGGNRMGVEFSQASRLALLAGLAMMVGTAAAAEGQGAPAGELTEIVVTAQRRAENLQKVPISVTALTGAEMQKRGATTAEDIQAVAPGFIFTQSLNSVTPSIRGVGTTDSSAAAEGAISLYVDGVYYSSM